MEIVRTRPAEHARARTTWFRSQHSPDGAGASVPRTGTDGGLTRADQHRDRQSRALPDCRHRDAAVRRPVQHTGDAQPHKDVTQMRMSREERFEKELSAA